MYGGEAVVQSLIKQGVKVIFGMPGGHIGYIYDSLYEHQNEIRHILVRNEQAASYMADGYARASGDAGICMTIPGPGASNAASGIAGAYTDSIPVMLITGECDTHLLNEDKSRMFHGLDQQRFFAPITGWNGRATTLSEIPEVISKAFHTMRTARPRPTQVEFPSDLLSAQGDFAIPERVNWSETLAPDSDIDKAIDILNKAERPLIIAGGGVIWPDASDEIAHLIKRLDAPIATTFMAKGVVPEDNPMSLGDVRGHIVRKAVDASDAVLAIGCRWSQMEAGSWVSEFPKHTIHIDADEKEVEKNEKVECEVKIVADSKVVAKQLLEKLDECSRDAWVSYIASLKAQAATEERNPLIMQMREVLDKDALVAVDVHIHGYRMRAEFTAYQPRTLFYPFLYVTLGYGFPASIGAKLAYPNRQVVAFCGDGGFLMTSQELATAVQFGVNVVAIVINDGALTSIKSMQKRDFAERYIGVDLRNPDFVKFAESFGVRGMRVTRINDFGSALKEALAANEPALIDVTREALHKNH